MDILEFVTPTWSQHLSYTAANNLVSTVRADCFNLEDKTLLVIATEIEENAGPSITNSVEEFAKKVATLFPTFKNYQFIECYRWDGSPTFDKVDFIEESFEKPAWKHLTDADLYMLIDEIQKKQYKVEDHASVRDS